MTEIRTIHRHEASDFLKLMCEVFDLDPNRANDVFFTEPLFDLDRKWCLFDNGEMISILTTSPLEFGWGRAIGIAGVATRQDRTREGHASRLLQHVMSEARKQGEHGALLFAKDKGFYERNGFDELDQIVRGPIRTDDDEDFPDCLEYEEIELRYDRWSHENPNRLRRDKRRWDYWRWHYRICTPFQDGYLSIEPGVLREPMYTKPVDLLPLPNGTEWFGSTSMAAQLEIPFDDPVVDLYLMGQNVPGIPQLYMTDQF